jgi:hypothetical protein
MPIEYEIFVADADGRPWTDRRILEFVNPGSRNKGLREPPDGSPSVVVTLRETALKVRDRILERAPNASVRIFKLDFDDQPPQRTDEHFKPSKDGVLVPRRIPGQRRNPKPPRVDPLLADELARTEKPFLMLMHAILRLQRVERESFGDCNPIEDVIDYRLSKLTPEIVAALEKAPTFEDFESP